MKGIMLLNHTEDINKIESEEKTKFLRNVLEQLGIPLDFWNDEVALSVSDKKKLRTILFPLKIRIIDQDNLLIYHEDKKIAEWKKCTYILKKDEEETDRKKQLYLELHINYWSIFEEENE